MAEKGEILKVQRLSSNAILPSKRSSRSAGFDLFSAATVVVPARGNALIPTDLRIALPKNTYATTAATAEQVWRLSIWVHEEVIDADYRGPIGVLLLNKSDQDIVIKVGDGIAVLLIRPKFFVIIAKKPNIRGAGGFGSTGNDYISN